MNNSIWFHKGSDSLANGEMCYDNSTRIDHKRGHLWFTDTSEQEMFFNKKQAVEFINETPGPAYMDCSSWHGGSSSQSEGQRGDRRYGPKPDPSSVVSDNNMEKKGFDNQFGSDSSICLSMCRAAENHLFHNNGLRKVKVNEVAISGNCLPQPVGNNNNKVMSSTFMRTGNTMCPGLTYNTADGNLMLTNQYYNGIDNNMLSIGQIYNRGSYDTSNTVLDYYGKGNSQFLSVGPTTNSNKGLDNFFSADPFYSKVNEPFMSYNKGDKSVAFCGKQDVGDIVPYTKENCSISSMVENSKKGEQTTTISFGGFESNPERELMNSYDGVLDQSSARPTGASGQKDSTGQQSESVISAVTSKGDVGKRNKEVKTKKGSSNNFPSNVKSLLSTGIFDGVPVKYVSWSREKNLRGVVKGTGYLCSCEDCKLSKAVNAYEFERHAGCKTKHPNNHIYFENGKTIYAVVQELKSTPHKMLFEVIQNATGSSVNQKNFITWKASYQAATRELQRIYGNDDMIVSS
ncbi:hypothetical protein OROHE_009606 [Orobanche hederae]